MPSLADNQIDLGYPCFYVMYKFKIIYYLMKIFNISLAAANSIWEEGYDFDQRIYEVINFIIEKEEPCVIINRNPTLTRIKFGVVKLFELLERKNQHQKNKRAKVYSMINDYLVRIFYDPEVESTLGWRDSLAIYDIVGIIIRCS